MFRQSLLVSVVVLTAAFEGCAGETKMVERRKAMETYVYKTVDGCEIKADVYGGAGDGKLHPTAISIHGGALVMGGRRWMNDGVRDRLLRRGFVIVSIDYRLAPEVKLESIIEDIRDAHKWVREEGPELFGSDPDRIGVIGDSAGGYLTLMSGFCFEPRPKALISLYGYGDIIGDWYSRPDPFYCTKHMVSTREAYSVVGGEILSEAIGTNHRGAFYLYCRQHGLWPNEVVGLDPHIEPEAFKPYCPVQNVTGDYPPTFLIHGDKDTDVPHEQSVMMAKELVRAGVAHEFITIEGAGHGFRHAGPDDLRQAYDKTVAFFERYVNAGCN